MDFSLKVLQIQMNIDNDLFSNVVVLPKEKTIKIQMQQLSFRKQEESLKAI